MVNETATKQQPDMTITVEVGRLLCRHLRDMLDSEQFGGRDIRWREGSGWFSRIFTIRGNPKDVEAIRNRINHWIGAMGG